MDGLGILARCASALFSMEADLIEEYDAEYCACDLLSMEDDQIEVDDDDCRASNLCSAKDDQIKEGNDDCASDLHPMEDDQIKEEDQQHCASDLCSVADDLIEEEDDDEDCWESMGRDILSMDGIESRGSLLRIKNCAHDLLSMEDDLIREEDEGQDYWELIGRDLCLKSTFLYCDLSRVISSPLDAESKMNLTELSNRLFYCLEELCRAVKSRSIPQTQQRFRDAACALQEVVAAACQKKEAVAPPVPSDSYQRAL